MSLDKILEENNIIPQSYHSRSFIGNHCHKYLNVYNKLTDQIIKQTRECTTCQDTVDSTYLIKYDFDRLNGSFAAVHNAISHNKPITQPEITHIQENINTYMKQYRQMFPNKTIPKQHILEHHCVPFIQLTNIGLGCLGEQGTEASHQAVKKLEKRASGLKQDIQ